MSTDADLTTLTDIPFHWEFVPLASEGPEQRERWTEHMVEFFGKWAGRTLDTARAAWTAGEFPFTAEMVGQETARVLLEKADDLGRSAGHRSRWSPNSTGPVATTRST
jgi:hypothetical protein